MYVKVEDVKEGIKKYFHDLIDAGERDVDVVVCAVELQRIVDKVPGIGWISVEEAVPEDDRNVLVFLNGKYGNITFIDSIMMGSYYEEGWLIEGYPHIEHPKVSHWMELPEGPGERRDESCRT